VFIHRKVSQLGNYFVFATLIALFSGIGCLANELNERPRILVRTKYLKSFLEFRGSEVTNLVLVRVYFDAYKCEPVLYEKLFYSNGQVLGCRRESTWIWHENKPIDIVLEFEQEKHPFVVDAGVNAAGRILVDAILQGRQIGSVMAPSEYFEDAVESFAHFNFNTFATTNGNIGPVNFSLSSDDYSKLVGLTYAKP
jgi:hypothetical protein